MTRTALAWLCCALPLAAQATIVHPIAADLLTVGPAGWRQRLGPTNLGSLLASAAGRELWSDGAEQIDGVWRHLLGVEAAAFATARQRLLDYSGSVQVQVRLVGEGRDPRMLAAVAFAPDGRTDMTALATDLRSLMARAAEQDWQVTKVGDRDVQTISRGDEVLLAPWLHEGRILLAMTPETELAAAHGYALALEQPPAQRPDSPAVWLRIDVSAIRATMRDGRDADEMTALGADAVHSLEVLCGAAGPHVFIEPRLVFGDGDRGLLGALFPAAKGPSTFLTPAPTAASWKAGHIDLTALWIAGEKLVAAFSGQEPAEIRKETVDELGIDPIDDMLAFAATDYLLTGAFEQVIRGGPADVLFALRLRDDAKFRTGFKTMLDKSKPFLQREAATTHGEVEIWRYGGMFTGDLLLAVGEGMLVCAHGEGAEAAIQARLDAAGAKKGTEAPVPTLPWPDLVRYAPASGNGAALADVPLALKMLSVFGEILEEMLPFPIDALTTLRDEEELERITAALREHHLDRVRTLTGHDGTTWRFRLLW